jgi:ElaA protein
VLTWQLAKLDGLDARDLLQALRLRQQVFVLEQRCLYPDIDALDERAWHLLGRDPDRVLMAYLRLIPPSGRYPGPALGRIVTRPDARGQGLGQALVHEGIRAASAMHPGAAIFISAQTYLDGFYRRFGFLPEGGPFMEDGIEHIEMVRPAASGDPAAGP